MITHDLGVVAGLCDSVHVMYQGRVVESAHRRLLFAQPRHPYTRGLLSSVPRLDTPRGRPLTPIPGSPTDVLPWAEGCAFVPRCGNRIDTCSAGPPPLAPVDGRTLRCYNPVTAEQNENPQQNLAAGTGEATSR
jgi:peptide/nickel transport system ATP-binding protein